MIRIITLTSGCIYWNSTGASLSYYVYNWSCQMPFAMYKFYKILDYNCKCKFLTFLYKICINYSKYH